MDKEELRKEFYTVMEYSEPFGNEYHDELFNWMWSKIEQNSHKHGVMQAEGSDVSEGAAVGQRSVGTGVSVGCLDTPAPKIECDKTGLEERVNKPK